MPPPSTNLYDRTLRFQLIRIEIHEFSNNGVHIKLDR